MISFCCGYLIILSSDSVPLTDRPSGWLAGCEETKVCRFLVFLRLCMICRYLLDSQDQYVSLGSSALDRNLVNADGILNDDKRICYLSTLWKGHLDLMYLYYRGRESPGRGHKQCFQESLLMFEKTNIFYGVQFAVSLVSLNDRRSQNSDRIKKVRTIFEHSKFIFAAMLSIDRNRICYE